MEEASLKEWLETKAREEGLKIDVRFIKDDYTAKAFPAKWRKKATIAIPDCIFDDIFTADERKAVGAHEIAHLKFKHAEIDEKWGGRKFFVFMAVLIVTSSPLFGFFAWLDIGEKFSTALVVMVMFVVTTLFLRRTIPQCFHLKRLHEFEADKYAAETTNPAFLISYFEKSSPIVEKWRKKKIWRARMWYRKKNPSS